MEKEKEEDEENQKSQVGCQKTKVVMNPKIVLTILTARTAYILARLIC